MLELSCTDHRPAEGWLRARGCRYLSADVSPELPVDPRRPQLGRTPGPLPFANGQCDVVVCLDVLGRVLKPDRVTSEIHRVLRPGGRLVATVPNAASWRHRLAFRGSADGPAWAEGQIRIFTAASLRCLLARDFRAVRLERTYGGLAETLSVVATR